MSNCQIEDSLWKHFEDWFILAVVIIVFNQNKIIE